MVETEREGEGKWLEEKASKRTVARFIEYNIGTWGDGTRLFRGCARINTRMRGGFIPRGYPSISKLYDSRQLGTESGINSPRQNVQPRSRFESATRDSDRNNFLRYHSLTTSLLYHVLALYLDYRKILRNRFFVTILSIDTVRAWIRKRKREEFERQ